MMRFVGSVAIVLVLSVFCGSISADEIICSNFTSMAVYPQNFTGTWYLMANSNKNIQHSACVFNTFNYNGTNDIWTVNTTYAPSASNLFTHSVSSINLNMTDFNATGGYTYDNTTYKLVDTDSFQTYILVCAYDTDNDTDSYGIMWSNNYAINATVLNNNWQQGSNKTMEFNNTMPPPINQSPNCYKNGAATTVPMLSALFVAVYAALKLLN